MTPMRFAALAALLSAALAPAACSTGPDPLLPPLAQVEVPVVERRELPTPKPAPITLVGQTPRQILEFLGEPDLKRREEPADIWRYGDESCGVHLFFYEVDGAMSVQHVETRLAGDNRLSEAECLDSLRRPDMPSAD